MFSDGIYWVRFAPAFLFRHQITPASPWLLAHIDSFNATLWFIEQPAPTNPRTFVRSACVPSADASDACLDCFLAIDAPPPATRPEDTHETTSG